MKYILCFLLFTKHKHWYSCNKTVYAVRYIKKEPLYIVLLECSPDISVSYALRCKK